MYIIIYNIYTIYNIPGNIVGGGGIVKIFLISSSGLSSGIAIFNPYNE